jgi:O-antigen/teichoic acid export membrane protein
VADTEIVLVQPVASALRFPGYFDLRVPEIGQAEECMADSTTSGRSAGLTGFEPSAESAPGRLRAKVAKGGFVLMARQFVLAALSVVGALVTTRMIGPFEYGTYITALTMHAFIAGVFGLGVQAYLIRVPLGPDDRVFDIASTFLLALGCICGFVEILVFVLFGSYIGVGHAVPILVFLACTLPVQLGCTPAAAILDRQLSYERIALVDLIGVTIYYLLAIALAFSGWGAWALATGWTIQQGANFVGYHVTAGWRPHLAWNWKALREMLRYSILWASSGWIWQARSLVNPLIIGNLLGVEAVGFVSLTQRLVDMLCFTRPIVWRIAMAAFARVQNEPRKLVRAIEDGMELQALAIGPPLILFAVFGKDMVGVFFGERWLPSFTIFPFVALANFWLVLFTLHSSALAVYARNLGVALFNMLDLIVFSACTLVLVPKLGVKAIGIADVLALSTLTVLDWNFRRRVGSLSYLRIMPLVMTISFALALSSMTRWAGLFPMLALASPGTWDRLWNHFRSAVSKA